MSDEHLYHDRAVAAEAPRDEARAEVARLQSLLAKIERLARCAATRCDGTSMGLRSDAPRARLARSKSDGGLAPAGGGGASSGEDPLDVLSVAEAAKLLRVGKASLYSARHDLRGRMTYDGQNAIGPDGVVHQMAPPGYMGGVVCGAMKPSPNPEAVYWLFWSRKTVTCMACIAQMEKAS